MGTASREPGRGVRRLWRPERSPERQVCLKMVPTKARASGKVNLEARAKHETKRDVRRGRSRKRWRQERDHQRWHFSRRLEEQEDPKMRERGKAEVGLR